ncbi:hypothetical protein THIOKS12170009 [Thiocapsa sp. KS1]|nr:hypothetical protein THIOKS12170009 [Thiocapsa sp. KS1]
MGAGRAGTLRAAAYLAGRSLCLVTAVDVINMLAATPVSPRPFQPAVYVQNDFGANKAPYPLSRPKPRLANREPHALAAPWIAHGAKSFAREIRSRHSAETENE